MYQQIVEAFGSLLKYMDEYEGIKTPKIIQIFSKIEKIIPKEWRAAVTPRNYIAHNYPRERPLWIYAWPNGTCD